MTNERRLAHSPQAAVAAYTPAPGYSRDLDESDLGGAGMFTPITVDERGLWFGFPDSARQLPQGVVVRPLDRKTTRTRWATDEEKDEGVFGDRLRGERPPPVCQSPDGKRGMGLLVDDGIASGVCGSCPQASFGANGEKPLCDEIKSLRVLLKIDGRMEEAEIAFKSTNMGAYRTIAYALYQRGWDETFIRLRSERMKRGQYVWGEYRIEIMDAPPSLRAGVVNAPAREVSPPPPPMDEDEDDEYELPW